MSTIHPQAESYWAAREREKKREESARNAAILRAMAAESEQHKITRLKLAASRATLFVAILANFYAAAKGWGLL
jgi:hypothetical protein